MVQAWLIFSSLKPIPFFNVCFYLPLDVLVVNLLLPQEITVEHLVMAWVFDKLTREVDVDVFTRNLVTSTAPISCISVIYRADLSEICSKINHYSAIPTWGVHLERSSWNDTKVLAVQAFKGKLGELFALFLPLIIIQRRLSQYQIVWIRFGSIWILASFWLILSKFFCDLLHKGLIVAHICYLAFADHVSLGKHLVVLNDFRGASHILFDALV